MQCKKEQADRISSVVPERKGCALKTKCDEHYNRQEPLDRFYNFEALEGIVENLVLASDLNPQIYQLYNIGQITKFQFSDL